MIEKCGTRATDGYTEKSRILIMEGTVGCLTAVTPKVKLYAVGLHWSFFALYVWVFFYMSPVLEYRIFIWKVLTIFWMLSECDTADEKAHATVQVLFYPRCECSNAPSAVKGRSVGKHKELCNGICP